MTLTPFDIIRSDAYRYGEKRRMIDLLRLYAKNRPFSYQAWFRLCGARAAMVRLFARPMMKIRSRRTGIQIPPGTRIGPDFYVSHGVCVVSHPETRAGSNFHGQPVYHDRQQPEHAGGDRRQCLYRPRLFHLRECHDRRQCADRGAIGGG